MDAAAVWKKIISIHGDKGSMSKTNLLMQLQNSHYVEGDTMQEHLAKMVELKFRMGCLLSDESFMSYIQTLILLAPNF